MLRVTRGRQRWGLQGSNNANYLEDVHVHLVSIEVGIIRGCDLVVMIIRFRRNSAYMKELGTHV